MAQTCDMFFNIISAHFTPPKLTTQPANSTLPSSEQHPEHLLELGCEWNFRVFQCGINGVNLCPATSTQGVALLHGNALSFVSGHEAKIQVYRVRIHIFKSR